MFYHPVDGPPFQMQSNPKIDFDNFNLFSLYGLLGLIVIL